MTEDIRDAARAWVEANYPVLEDEDLDAEHYRYGDNPQVDKRSDIREALAKLIEEVLPGGEATPQYVFEADDWFEVPGRGDMAIIKNPAKRLEEYDIWEPGHLVNQWVSIDGKPYLVRGVETFLINRTPTKPYRINFSILVGKR